MSDLIGFDEEFDKYGCGDPDCEICIGFDEEFDEYGCGDPDCEICHPNYDDIGTFVEENQEEE